MRLQSARNALFVVPAVLVLLIGASPAGALPFFDFHGFSYADGAQDEVGTRVSVPTILNQIQPDPIWPLDFVNNEYTIMVEGLEVTNVESMGPILTITYGGGTISLLRDPSRNSVWAENPPNASVPSTFTDGEVQLVGQFTEMVLMYNTLVGAGTVSGTFNWNGGSLLGQLETPNGWTYFGGVSEDPGFGIPAGYGRAWDPQIYGPEPSVPVEQGTWGHLKQLYR